MDKLDDRDIRRVILKHVSNYKHVKVSEEVPTYSGKARADLIAINGHINAYEIKSDYDSLDRLNNQIKEYDKSFEKNNIITGFKYIEKVSEIVPSYWGIIQVIKNKKSGKLSMDNVRLAKMNPNIDFVSMLGLVDANNLKKIIITNDIYIKANLDTKEVRNAFKYELISELDRRLSKTQKDILKRHVRTELKNK